MRQGIYLLACFGAAMAVSGHARAQDVLVGPVEVRVVRVLDGDTFEADARVWPGHSVRVKIRIRGIDAPETRSRCAAEKTAGVRAREALADLIIDRPVSVSNIGGDKYYGRVLADVSTADGRDLAPTLLDLALVRAYGGGKRESLCE